MELNSTPAEMNFRAFEYYRPLMRIKKFIDINYGEEISLNQAARVAAMERCYFSTFFRRKVGINFRDWLRLIRIQKAMAMFAQEDYSISEVAFAVGFADLSTFERAFKKVTKLTPREYKRQVCAEIEPW